MLTPGARLGHFEVLGSLGKGGMGEVYVARDTRLGRDVALKILPAAFAEDPERMARFEREARVLANLNHPNIAGIYGVEEQDGARYLVLEYVEGESLATRIRSVGRLSVDDSLRFVTQTVDALTFLVGSGLAGVAGVAVTLLGSVGPNLGGNYIVDVHAGKLKEKIRIIDVKEDRVVARLNPRGGNTCAVAFSPDGSQLLIANNRVARLYDANSWGFRDFYLE